MSMYNMLHGFNPACVLIMPMLGRKQEDYPRFRDCFVKDGMIAIYTRVGRYNKGCGFGEEELYKDPNYVRDYSDDFDPTYGTYLFKVPDMWKNDFDKICKGRLLEVSDEYYNYVREFYPFLASEGVIDRFFRPAGGQDCNTEVGDIAGT